MLTATEAYCYEEVRNYGKNLSKALLIMDGEGMHPPHPPLDPPLLNVGLCVTTKFLEDC